MASQILFLLGLTAVQILGAPTQNLSVNPGNDSSLPGSQESKKEGRGIPIFIYDDGTGKSNLVPGAAAEEGRFSSRDESIASEASLIQNLMNPLNSDFNSLRGFGGLALPGLAGSGISLAKPNLTLPALTNTGILQMFPGLQNLINTFPFLSGLSGTGEVRNIQSRDSKEGVYLFAPTTGLVPINNITPRTKAARQGSSQSSAVELLQNIYNIYAQSLLEQQQLALQRHSLYGNPWPSIGPINPQLHDALQFNRPPFVQPPFSQFSFMNPIPLYPVDNPLPYFPVQPLAYPGNAMPKPVASELPFKILKEVTFEELLELLSVENEGATNKPKPVEPEAEKGEHDATMPITTSESPIKINTKKETAIDVPNQHDDVNSDPSQVRENSKFAEKITRRNDNIYLHDGMGRVTGPERVGSTSFRGQPFFGSYTLNRSL